MARRLLLPRSDSGSPPALSLGPWSEASMWSAWTDAEFIGTVEEITGRRVQGFVSGIDTGHDVSSEVVYFEPVPAA